MLGLIKLQSQISKLFVKSELKELVLLFIGILIMGFFELIGIASIAPFMAIVADPGLINTNTYLSFAYNYLGYTKQVYFLASMGVFVLLLLVISNSFIAAVNAWVVFFSRMQGHRLSVRLLDKYLAQPYSFYLSRNTAALGKNILSEVDRCIGGVILPTIQGLSKLVVTILIFLLLFLLNPALALGVTFVLGATYALVYIIAKRHLTRIGVLSAEAIEGRFKMANEAMSGIKELKLSGTESVFLERFSSPSDSFARFNSQSSLIAMLPRYILETIAFGGILCLIIYLLTTGKDSKEIFPIISLYAMAGYRLLPALQQIYSSITRVKYNLPALEILVDDLSKEHEISKKVSKQQALIFNNNLVLKDINFHYLGSASPILDDINIEIKANTTIGFVGPTGSGKTTLIDVLLGLLTPNTGKLIVDNVELTVENTRAWQKNIGYVPQSIYLTDDTIIKNIAFGINDNDIDLDKVKHAAKLADIDSFINTMPKNYNTFVGERGIRLSGGQCQRIGIARALYNNPSILVLDEATSALDSVTENAIIEAINKLSHKKTIIMIAHRLTTVKECDVIFMLDKGKITDKGKYDELLALNEKFRNMASV